MFALYLMGTFSVTFCAVRFKLVFTIVAIVQRSKVILREGAVLESIGDVVVAKAQDAVAISALLNTAYRSGEGWTHEQQLVSGQRAQVADIALAIENIAGCFLVKRDRDVIEACIYVERYSDGAMVGSFAVNPHLQGRGLGAYMLNAAECFAQERLSAKVIVMDVLAPRHELIAYYERKGYRRTGEQKAFPKEANAGLPFDQQLQVIRLKKHLK